MLHPTPPSKKTIRGVSRDTEVLTPKGFVNVTDVTQDTTLLQYHENGILSFTQPCSPIDIFHYNGLAYHFSTKNNKINQLITAEQRILYTHKNTHGEKVIKTTSCSDGIPLMTTNGFRNYYILGGQFQSPNHQKMHPLEKIKLLTTIHNVWVQKEMPEHNVVNIRTHLRSQLQYIVKLLTEANIPITQYQTVAPTKKLKKHSILLTVHLPQNTYTKDLAWVDIDRIGYEWSRDFVETLISIKSVSHREYVQKHPNGKEYIFRYHEHRVRNKELADKIQAIGFMGGFRTSRFTKREENDYILNFNKEDFTILTATTIVKPVEYNDLMVRIKVPSGFLVIRRNDSISITGG